jgi:DHA2 family multidrug resistance protein
MPFLFIPLMSISLSKIPGSLNNDASAITNLARNLGGSFGISFTTTLLAYREQFHHARLTEHITPYDGFGAAVNLAPIGRAVQAQAAILGYLDVFLVVALVSGVSVGLALMLPRLPKGAAAAAH